MLEVQDLVCRIGSKTIVDHISLSFTPGRLHVIVGPNGSGKSTFLKAFSGEWSPSAGVIRYDGQLLNSFPKMALARRRAVMTQLPELHFPLTVEEIVMMGRYPHFAFSPTSNDQHICRQVMDHLSIQVLSGRDYLTLSGGERQRVQFARALAQIWEAPATGSRYLFLDEPVSSLDIHYQHQFLHLARNLLQENVILVAILHDLNLALQYADRMIFMKKGRVIAAGDTPSIITPSLIQDTFDITARLLDDPGRGIPVIVYG
jgi:iron complex transport system ATP-binding protein